jgi:hypothetical protein
MDLVFKHPLLRKGKSLPKRKLLLLSKEEKEELFKRNQRLFDELDREVIEPHLKRL